MRTMLGWRRRTDIRASRWNSSIWLLPLSELSPSVSSWLRMNLSATHWMSSVSHALYTTPAPPRPSSLIRMYLPKTRLGSFAAWATSGGSALALAIAAADPPVPVFGVVCWTCVLSVLENGVDVRGVTPEDGDTRNVASFDAA